MSMNHDPSLALLGASLLDILSYRAQYQADRQAYIFLQNGETESGSLTYGELDRQARAIAAQIQSWQGERALLLYPSGLEFITAFFGCLYAGVIAVPVYPPRRNQNLSRLLSIVNDAQAKIALTSESILKDIDQSWEKQPELSELKLIATDSLTSSSQEEFSSQLVTPETLAFLQYTSGSTGTPKGVMVTHGNIIHNQKLIQQAFSHGDETIFVGWLPLFHDMGLIGNVLQPMYLGIPCILMPPVAFLQKPIRWLQTISKYRATTSGGPNFAYDLCVNQIRAAELADLDLSSWDLAFSGAEPVRAETLKRFGDKFAECGFSYQAFYPCYGMAECTLLATGGNKYQSPVIDEFNAKDIKENLAVKSDVSSLDNRLFVGCGRAHLETTAIIVDPESLTRCQPGKIGEIWIAGGSVAAGYWHRPEITQETFQAFLQDTEEGPFLRTGDLGFLDNEELFITGRLKDLIIIRGRNYYPQDIELTIEKSHPALRENSSATFAIDLVEGDGLVVVCEVERTYLRRLNVDEIVKAIKIALSAEHELDLHAVTLLKTGSILKTSSGKIQRHACKAGFIEDSLNNVVGQWQENSSQILTRALDSLSNNQIDRNYSLTTAEIALWLANQIAEMQQIPLKSIDLEQPLAVYGLSSIKAVSISAKLSEWLGRSLEPTIVYDYPTIQGLANHLGLANPTSKALPMVAYQQTKNEAIAIVGKGCRFPQADCPEAFWSLLSSGQDAITKVPVSRWDSDNDWGGFLDRVDRFDPQFFNISPREATNIDPQQRLLLEVSWEALENAGLVTEKLAGSRSGIFIGISSGDYAKLAGNIHNTEAYYGTGNALSIAANRLSYFLNWHGPSWAVDTACSSSLVAVHQACQSLLLGECDLALAGGVNLILRPQLTSTFTEAQMMAADGRCKTFDAAADGYVRSEGCGVIILKRLSDAIADGDNIQAIIRGSAVNQDGLTNGITAPNGNSQQEVIRLALAKAGVKPNQISYVETHGTGTALGDPIEINALKTVLMEDRELDRPCWIGSVKTNIGHLEAAAGVAGLIKVVLSLEHGEIPPHLHLKELNPYIQLDRTSIKIPTQIQSWSSANPIRIAGVSAFGFGGTNAHVILESAPVASQKIKPDRQREDIPDRPVHLLALSARTDEALQDVVLSYQKYLQDHEELAISDVCFSANTGRYHFKSRLAICAADRSELDEKLSGITSCSKPFGVFFGELLNNRKTPKVAFLFTGQGSQYVNMGYQLYQTQLTFRQAILECAELMEPDLDRPLLSILYPAVAEDSDRNPIHQTRYAQLALFALEYALCRLWQSWGIIPDVLLGHSVGEYVAAVLAGVMNLPDGVKLVAARARLMQSLPSIGEMVAVFADPEEIQTVVTIDDRRLSFAIYNNSQNTVIAGEDLSIAAACDALTSADIKFKKLKTSHAFHSMLMEPILAEFMCVAVTVSYHSPQIPLISNLTGQQIGANEIDAEYWCQHLRQTVKFADGLQTLEGLGINIFLEVGPKPTLIGIGQQCLGASNDFMWLSSLRPKNEDWVQMLNSLAQLAVNGVEIDWVGFDRDYDRQRIPLPTYPFQRKSYWIDDAPAETTPLTLMHKNHENLRSTAPNLSPPASVDMTNQQRQQDILNQLHTSVAKLLKADLAEVNIHTPFLELGADSLVLVEAINYVERTFGLKIAIRQIFGELTTIALLSEYIHEQIPPEITAPETVLIASANGNSLKHNESNKLSSASDIILSPDALTMNYTSTLERIMQQQLQVVSDLVAQQLAIFRQHKENFEPVVTPRTETSPTQQPIVSTVNKFGESHSSSPTLADRLRLESTLQLPPPTNLDRFINFYTQITSGSKDAAQNGRDVLADSRASAGFRPSIKELVYPIVGDRAEGAYCWDIDGNKYIDLTMGFGVLLFGHNPQFVKDAISEQLERGLQIGPQSQLASKVARSIAEFTGTERVAFCNSGTEAVMTAIRLARHATGRHKIVIFTNSYHGHFDGILATSIADQGQSIPSTTGISPLAISDVLVLEYGEDSALEILGVNATDIAAVIVEPVQSRNLSLQPREFLQQLRQLTTTTGITLIFDEVLLGFRIHQGGAQAWFDIKADLVTYGKIIGGGLPIGVVAGRKEYLDGIDGGWWSYGNASYPLSEKTFFAGTFNKNHLGMAAAHAVLQYLQAAGPSLQTELNQRTQQLVSTLNDFFTSEVVPIKVVNFGSLFRFDFNGNFDLFFYHLIAKGIYIWEGRACFLSTAHTDEDINYVVRAIETTVREMRADGFWPQSFADRSILPSTQQIATTVSSTATVQAEKLTSSSSSKIWDRHRDLSSRIDRKSVNLNRTIDSNLANLNKKLDFSLYYFGEYEAQFSQDKYDLLFAGAKFADRHGFAAIWIPERHFHSFGGFSPNPSVLGAGLARETKKIQIRAGSLVLPLHHPIRVAEEWSVVDNLSQGRVGVAFASGWHPNDFVFAPESYGNHRELMFQGIETVQKLWRGESIPVRGGAGNEINVQTFPLPMQSQLPTWITIVNNPETYIKAGEIGAGVLTNLMNQTIEDLAANIVLYRESLSSNGHNPESGQVTVLLHTLVGNDIDIVRAQARQPFCNYLRSSLGLFQNLVKSQGLQVDIDSLSEDDKNIILSAAFDRYVQNSALIGTPDSCDPIIKQLLAIGVNEIACFIDFGVSTDIALESLPYVNELKERYQQVTPDAAGKPLASKADDCYPLSIAQQRFTCLSQLGEDGKKAGNTGLAIKFNQAIDSTVLETAWRELLARHDCLRTVINISQGTQKLSDSNPASFIEIEVEEDNLNDALATSANQSFDLSNGYLAEATLIKTKKLQYYFCLVAHHTVADGWSLAVFIQELFTIYQSYQEQTIPQLNSLTSYRNYVNQESLLCSEQALSYWLEQYKQYSPQPLFEPVDPDVSTFLGKRLHYSSKIEFLENQLERISKQMKCTPFIVLFSLFQSYLYKTLKKEVFVVKVPISSRNTNSTGCCINILPIICGKGHWGERLDNLIPQVKQEFLEAFEQQNFDYQKWSKMIDQPLNLMQVSFNLDRKMDLSIFNDNNDNSVSLIPLPINYVEFPLMVNIQELDNSLQIELDYQERYFTQEQAEKILINFGLEVQQLFANEFGQLRI